MCEHKADFSHKSLINIDGKDRSVDKCIWKLIYILNQNGFKTVSSCCGHGNRPGNIMLKDGRELIIAKNYAEGRKIDKLFPLDIHGKPWGIHINGQKENK